MGRPAGWMKELTGRSPMKSPGAPSLRREVERRFWGVIAAGVTAEQAAVYRPADDLAGPVVEHRAHIELALSCRALCDVGHPELVRPVPVELTVHKVSGWSSRGSA